MSGSTGRIALAVGGAIVGAVIGSFAGNPVLGARIGFLAGSIAGAVLFPTQLPTIEGPRLGDLTVTASSYGAPVRILYGRMRMGGTVVWSPGLVEHRQEEEVGGKGGSSQTQVTYTYTASWRVVFCEGVADTILRIWADGKLVGDLRPPSESSGLGIIGDLTDAKIAGSLAASAGVRKYLGTETQEADPAEQADKGVALTPAYRGLVSLVFQDIPLADYGNRIPQVTAEIVMAATESFPSDTLTGLTYNGTYWAWQPGGTTFLTATLGDIARIDNVNQIELNSISTAFGTQSPCIDAEGHFYRIVRNTGPVIKYDGVTFGVLTTGNVFKDPFTGDPITTSNLDFKIGRIFGGVTLPDGTIAGELLFVQVGASSSVTLIIDINALSSGNGGVINKYSTAAIIGDALVVDDERHLWAYYNSGGDTILNRVAPGNGDITETYTVSGDTTTNMAYESSTNSLILGNGASHLIRWSIDTQAIVARLDNITFVSGEKNESHFWNGPSPSGKMYLQTGAVLGDFTEFDILTMVEGQTWNPGDDFGLHSSNEHRGMYDPLHHAKIIRDDTGKIHWLYLDRQSGDSITVQSIVEDVTTRVGLTVGTDIDATALTDTLTGYTIDRRMPARNALEPLAGTYFFRSVESDFIVDFPKRGSASVATIPEADLAAHAGSAEEDVVSLDETVLQEVELPEMLDIIYSDEGSDYQANVQTAKRPRASVGTRQRLSMQFPGVITNDFAAQTIEKILYTIWSNRKPFGFLLSQKYLELDPADVVTITKDSDSFLIELAESDLGVNNVITLKGILDTVATYSSDTTGSDGGAPEQTITLTVPSEFFVLDSVLMRDADDGFGIYVAAGAFNSLTWPGAVFQRALDFTNYLHFTSITPSRNVGHGWATTTLADASPDLWDRTNTITIKLFNGSVASSTETAVLDGANALLIGDEIVQFVTAAAGSDSNEYTLSALLRGRRGSEWATSTHATGERVIILSASTLLRIALDTSELNTTYNYKATTVGGSSLGGVVKSRTNTGRSQKPYAPTFIRGSISSDDWTINWERRTRIGGSWKDALNVILGEFSEDYEIDVLEGSTVVRTITTTASANGSVITASTRTALYDDQDQIADFSGAAVQTTLTIVVYQMSEIVGRGFGRTVTLVGG